MPKKVVLVIFSFSLSKKEKLALERAMRADILVQHKEKVCIEFYNEKEFDFFRIKFNKILKKRAPASTLFVDCPKETIENLIIDIQKKVNREVAFFFKSMHIGVKEIPLAKKIEKVGEMSLYLTAIA